MRRYGYIPSPNAAANTPAVSATTGLGTGGGAGVQTPDSGNFGDVIIDVGSDPSEGGTVVLTFPDTPPALFIAASEGMGQVTQETVDNDVTVTWTATPPAGTRQSLHYEWSDPLEPNP